MEIDGVLRIIPVYMMRRTQCANILSNFVKIVFRFPYKYISVFTQPTTVAWVRDWGVLNHKNNVVRTPAYPLPVGL